MICSSSALKLHKPGGRTCKPNHPHPCRAKAQILKDAMKRRGAGYTIDEQDLIGRVVDLMLAGRVNSRQHFTIVHSA